MNRLFYLIAFAAASLVMVACSEEEKESFPPTYYGFTYQPKPATVGGEVTITAVQEKKGQYLNGTDYKLSLQVTVIKDGVSKDSTVVSQYNTNYDGTDNGNPTFKVKIPENTISNTARVSFKASWSNSCDGIGGVFGGNHTEGYLGTIESISSTLYSNARGSFTMSIKQ